MPKIFPSILHNKMVQFLIQRISDVGVFQWSRICSRIIVDETQKERRLNWTFVDKFFCWNVFLKREVLMNEKMKDRWM